ncbi:Ig-like domain (group 3) [Treponema bryantii]|uniref:Ig-like domain (Group 3) n=1 Tax=Treponema bryantii TaxID=163 RepID=A0A1H9H9W3_9SPIR|nr:Ig-like domain-containing protein [Treponema bryantii]SEQ59122.1 Ig-like domain (group 3) [Treponema bryantii]
MKKESLLLLVCILFVFSPNVTKYAYAEPIFGGSGDSSNNHNSFHDDYYQGSGGGEQGSGGGGQGWGGGGSSYSYTGEIKRNQTESWSGSYKAWTSPFNGHNGDYTVSFHINEQYVKTGNTSFIVKKNTSLNNMTYEYPQGYTSVHGLYLVNGTAWGGGIIDADSTYVFRIHVDGLFSDKDVDYLTLYFTVDDDKPIVDYVAPGNDWFTTDKSFDISVSDVTTNIFSVEIRGAEYKKINNSKYNVTVNKEGTSNIYIDVYDEVLNRTSKYTTVRIDKTDPILEISEIPTGWQKNPIRFDVTARDTISGVKTITVYDKTLNQNVPVYSTLSGKEGSSLFKRSFRITGNGEHVLEIKAQDVAGRTTTQTRTVKIDNASPSFDVVCSKNNQWTNKDVLITGVAKDPESGLKNVWLEIDGNADYLLKNGDGSKKEISFSRTISKEGVTNIYSNAEDFIGNPTTKGNTCNIKIDKSSPQISIDSANYENGWTNKDISITITADDKYSGIKDFNTSCILNGKEEQIKYVDTTNGTKITRKLSLNKEGIYNLTITCNDNVGNPSTIITKTYKIDKTAIDENAISFIPIYKENVRNYRTALGLDNLPEFAGALDKIRIIINKNNQYESEPSNIEIGGNNYKPILNGNKYQYDYSVSHLVDDTYNLNFKINDAATNNILISKTIIIDRIAKTLEADNFSIGDSLNPIEICKNSIKDDTSWVISYKTKDGYGNPNSNNSIDVYKKTRDGNISENVIKKEKRDDGVYNIHVENVDQYGNHEGNELYLLWRNGEKPNVEEIQYENTSNGYKAFIEIPVEKETVSVWDKHNITYEREYMYVYKSKEKNEVTNNLTQLRENQNSSSLSEEQESGNFKIYTSNLKGLIDWESDDKTARTIKVFYTEDYKPSEIEKEKIKVKKGQSIVNEYFVKDSKPVFNKYIQWPEYIGDHIILSCKAPDNYFKAIAVDPDDDTLLFKITLINSDNKTKVIYKDNLTSEIKLQDELDTERFDYSTGLTVKIEAKGIRKNITETDPDYETYWNNEKTESTELKPYKYEANKIDSKAPYLDSYNKDYWENSNNWTGEQKSVLSFKDDGSGIYSIYVEYKKDDIILNSDLEKNINNNNFSYSVDFGKVAINNEALCGYYSITIVVTDTAGNSAIIPMGSVKIDTEKPKIINHNPKNPLPDSDGDIQFEFEATDFKGSQVKQYSTKTEAEEKWSEWYTYDNKKRNTLYILKNRFGDKARKLKLKVRDNVNNESEESGYEIICEPYEQISEIVELRFEGINEKGYVTNIENLKPEIKFNEEIDTSECTVKWTIKDLEDNTEQEFDSFSELKSVLKDGKEYKIKVSVENKFGSKSEKTCNRSIKIETTEPSEIYIETDKEILKGHRHEIIVKGGLDDSCNVKRTVYVVKKDKNDQYELLYSQETKTDDENEIIRLSTGLFEDDILKENVYIYAESENDAGLVTKSSMIHGFVLKENSDLFVEADEYTSGSIFARWITGKSETKYFKYTIKTSDNEILLDNEKTDNKFMVYDLPEGLIQGTYIYIYVTGYTEDDSETENGKSNAVLYCNEHPDVEWIKVPKAVLSSDIWAEYNIRKGIGIKTKKYSIEVFEKNPENEIWDWYGVGDNRENIWINLNSNEGRITLSLENLKEKGRIHDGSQIRIKLAAENNAGLETQVITGAIIIDDSKPPLPVAVDQGTVVNQIQEPAIKVDWSTSINDPDSGSIYYWKWYFEGEDKEKKNWIEAEWNTEKNEQLMYGIIDEDIRKEKYDGKVIRFEVKAINGTGEESIGKSDGILLDSNAPIIEKIQLYDSENGSLISGYTRSERIGDFVYISIDVNEETSWIEKADAILYEIDENGIHKEVSNATLTLKGKKANAKLQLKDKIDICNGKRFIVQAVAKDAAGNRSGSASSDSVLLVGSPVEIEHINIQGDIKKLNITWGVNGDNQWTKEYLVNILYEKNNILFHTNTTSLSLDWSTIGINISDDVNGTIFTVTVKPVSYTSDYTEENEKTESFMIDLQIPVFNEEKKCIPQNPELTAWANEINAYVEYISGVTGCSIEWASIYAEDNSELSGWILNRISNSININKLLNEISENKLIEFWQNKHVMLKFKAINGMGLSSIEKKVTPVLIDITKPETAEISRNWVWSNLVGNIDNIIVSAGDKDSGLSAYICALINKENAGSDILIENTLAEGNINYNLLHTTSKELYQENDLQIPIIGTEEGIYNAVLGVRNGSGIWTYVKSSDIEIDRTAPEFDIEKSLFTGTKKQNLMIGDTETVVHVTNGPKQQYSFTSNEEVLWNVYSDGQLLSEVRSEEYLSLFNNLVDFETNSDGKVYKLIIDMTDKAGNKGTRIEYLRYNKAPVIKILYDEGKVENGIIVWPGHTKTISELFDLSDYEEMTEGDYPLSYTWTPGNGEDTHSWIGGMDIQNILGTDGNYKTTYYQENEKAQVSEYKGILTVEDCYGKGSSIEVWVTVENTRKGALIVDEYWTGTHSITGIVTVPVGKKLSLENIQVTAEGFSDENFLNSGIDVYGTMEVKGTVNLRSGNSVLKWKGIKIDGELNGDLLDINSAQRGLTLLANGKVKLEELKIDNCLTGLHLFGGSLKTDKLTVINSKQYGIKEEEAGQYEYGEEVLDGNGRNSYIQGITK